MPASSKTKSPSTISSNHSDNRAEFALFSSIPPTYRAFRSLRVASAARFHLSSWPHNVLTTWRLFLTADTIGLITSPTSNVSCAFFVSFPQLYAGITCKIHFLERMSLKNLYICEKSSNFARCLRADANKRRNKRKHKNTKIAWQI